MYIQLTLTNKTPAVPSDPECFEDSDCRSVIRCKI